MIAPGAGVGVGTVLKIGEFGVDIPVEIALCEIPRPTDESAGHGDDAAFH